MTLHPGSSAEVTVPASSANLGPGFDTIGLALGLRDRYAVRVTERPGLVVELHGEGAADLPTDESHLVVRALRRALQLAGACDLSGDGTGLALRCDNVIPLSAGLGSSASAVVGGLGLGFALAGHASRGAAAGSTGFTDAELALANTCAGVWEGHPDNSSASVYGGLTVSWMPSAQVVRTARPAVHPDIEPVVLLPDAARLPTSAARAVLPPQVSHGDAVRQAGRAALLVHALSTEPALLWDATADWLHQDHRRTAYPGSMAAVDTLRAQGHAAVVSGAGPSVLVLARGASADHVQDEARGWGRDWTVLRPGIDACGLRATCHRPAPQQGRA